ncbi:hypothetical protein B0H66DRAFT_377531 [Apodospora peruviana]|uniref:PD-(D/E)XK nuclease-like domain-containing protein n=1 Tax=Apodospora peruviana TaxID=516989 RepID=A0AAE0HTI3_9PEZI|nr:hypothetical protein B0H66DRAFT_377531 [Apodospora peruviana]
MKSEAIVSWLFGNHLSCTARSSRKRRYEEFAQESQDTESPNRLRMGPTTTETGPETGPDPTITTDAPDSGRVFQDWDATPKRPHHVAAMADRRILIPRSPSRRGAARSPSPEKIPKIATIEDLWRRLATPIHYTFPTDLDASFDGPYGVQQLYDRLFDIENGQSFLPPSLRDRLGQSHGSTRRLLPSMWMEENETGPIEGRDRPSRKTQLELEMELAQITDIVTRSAKGFRQRWQEPEWNTKVHCRVLDLAFGSAASSVQWANVTKSQTAEPFRPRLATQLGVVGVPASIASSSSAASLDSLQSDRASTAAGSGTGVSGGANKLVDFALYLDPSNDNGDDEDGRRKNNMVNLGEAVRSFLSSQPVVDQWINGLAVAEIRECPAPVYIETKTASGRYEDALVQLGICVSGWHNRMHRILDQRQQEPGRLGSVITGALAVPAIVVMQHQWEAFFAVDAKALPGQHQADELHMVGPALRLGDTASVLGMYRLLASLRAIGDWIEGGFANWMEDILAGISN